MERFDAVVVGAGAAGSAAARSLTATGRSCVVLERFPLGHAEGSSHGSARIFRLSYHHPDYVRMALAAREAWRELEGEAGTSLLTSAGGLDIGPNARTAAEALAAAGVTFAWLSPAEVAERWPGIRPPNEPVLFQEDAGVCAADRTLETLQELARKQGAEIRPGVVAETIRSSANGVEVRTDAGTIEAPVAVVAAGGWAGPLLATADIELPLTVTLEQVLYLTRSDDAPQPSTIEWRTPAVYAVADPSAAVLKVGEHHAKRVVSADDRRHDVDPGSIARVRAWARERFGDVADAEGTSETCLYTVTPDEDFVIDRIGNVVISSACSGHGFKFTPLLGQLLAELATGAEPSVPLDRFRAARFADA